MALRTDFANTTNMTDEHPAAHNQANAKVNALEDVAGNATNAAGTAQTAAEAAQADIDVTQFNVAFSGVGWVNHGSTAATARPNRGFAIYIWVGSVEPTNATNNDLWLNTAAT